MFVSEVFYRNLFLVCILCYITYIQKYNLVYILEINTNQAGSRLKQKLEFVISFCNLISGFQNRKQTSPGKIYRTKVTILLPFHTCLWSLDILDFPHHKIPIDCNGKKMITYLQIFLLFCIPKACTEI